MDILTQTLPAIPEGAWPFIIIWTVTLKGLALWRSSRLSQKYWFIIMLVFNLFGALELVYLLFFSEGFLTQLLSKRKTKPRRSTSKKRKK